MKSTRSSGIAVSLLFVGWWTALADGARTSVWTGVGAGTHRRRPRAGGATAVPAAGRGRIMKYLRHTNAIVERASVLRALRVGSGERRPCRSNRPARTPARSTVRQTAGRSAGLPSARHRGPEHQQRSCRVRPAGSAASRAGSVHVMHELQARAQVGSSGHTEPAASTDPLIASPGPVRGSRGDSVIPSAPGPAATGSASQSVEVPDGRAPAAPRGNRARPLHRLG